VEIHWNNTVNKLSIEEVIQEAQKDGRFSNLPGKGQPLRLDPSPDAVVNGLLNEANVRPEWVEVAQEIDDLQDKASQLLARYEQQYAPEYSGLLARRVVDGNNAQSPRRRWWQVLISRPRSTPDAATVEDFQRQWNWTLARYAALLHQANGKIRRFNHLVPGLGRQRSMISVEERLNDFVAKFPLVQQTAEGLISTQGSIRAELLMPPPDAASTKLPRDLQAGRILHHVERSKRRKRCEG